MPTKRGMMADKAERLQSMKHGKVVHSADLFCDQCGFQLCNCNGCDEAFDVDEDVICDKHELSHYCQACIEENK